MKKQLSENVQLILAIICLIVVLGLSIGLTLLNPTFYNPVTQILLDFSLLIFAAWLGNSWKTAEAKKNSLEKWVPMAETACKDLLVINATVQRSQKKQGNVCMTLKPLIGMNTENNSSILTNVIDMRCNECMDDLETLRLLVNNSFSNWDAFIETNCDENTCEQIHRRINEKRKELSEVVLIASSEPDVVKVSL